MSRFRNALVSNMSDLKRKALVVLDQTFPEYQSIFSDVLVKLLRKSYLNMPPSDYEQISIDDLTQIIEQTSRNRLGKKTANKLMELASNSFGVTFCKNAFPSN